MIHSFFRGREYKKISLLWAIKKKGSSTSSSMGKENFYEIKKEAMKNDIFWGEKVISPWSKDCLLLEKEVL